MLPALAPVIGGLTRLAGVVGTIIEANPKIASGLVVGATAFMGLRMAITAARIASLAFCATPVGAALAGVSVLAGLIIANWEDISKFFSELWDGMAGGAEKAFKAIKTAFEYSGIGLMIKGVSWLYDRVNYNENPRKDNIAASFEQERPKDSMSMFNSGFREYQKPDLSYLKPKPTVNSSATFNLTVNGSGNPQETAGLVRQELDRARESFDNLWHDGGLYAAG